MYMKDWAKKLDAFLQFNEEEILNNKGEISRSVAAELAIKEYEKFRIKQDNKYLSDFDMTIKSIKKKLSCPEIGLHK